MSTSKPSRTINKDKNQQKPLNFEDLVQKLL